jgi:hypothetical protein
MLGARHPRRKRNHSLNRISKPFHPARKSRAGAEGEMTRQGEEIIGSAERYRHNADDCRQRSQQARTAADKANWLKIAEEWQKLAEEVDLANGQQTGGS